MDSNKTTRRIVIGALALIALFAVGSMGVFSTGRVSAQISELAPETAGESVERGRFIRAHFGRGHRGHDIDKAQAVADALGITVEELESAREDGMSIEALAEANGTTVEAIKEAVYQSGIDAINQAVTDGEITQEQADEMLARIELKHLASQVIDKDALKQVAADATGVTIEELETAKENREMSDLLEKNSVTKEEVMEAVQTAKDEMIDQAVADGTLTEEQGEQLKEGHGHGKRGCGGRRGGGASTPGQFFTPRQAPSTNTNA